MKKVFLAAVLMIGITSFAQEAPKLDKGERAKMEALSPEQKQQLHLKKLTLDLNLSSSQQKEFASLLQENSKKREAAKAEFKARKDKGDKLTSDERFAMRSKMLDEKIAMKDKVRKILSAEQFGKWEKMQERHKDGLKHHAKGRGKKGDMKR